MGRARLSHLPQHLLDVDAGVCGGLYGVKRDRELVEDRARPEFAQTHAEFDVFPAVLGEGLVGAAARTIEPRAADRNVTGPKVISTGSFGKRPHRRRAGRSWPC